MKCPECHGEGKVSAEAVVLTHRQGCEFAAALLEAEASGKPVTTIAGGRVLQLVTVIGQLS